MSLPTKSVDFHRDRSPYPARVSRTESGYRKNYDTRRRPHMHTRNFHHRIRTHRHSAVRTVLSIEEENRHRSKISPIVKRQFSPSAWEEHRSSTGRIYYYNSVTDRSQWEKPASLSVSKQCSTKHGIHFRKFSKNDHYQRRMKPSIKKFRFTSTHSPHHSRSRISRSNNRFQSYQRTTTNKVMFNISKTKESSPRDISHDHHKRQCNFIQRKSSSRKLQNDEKNLNDSKLLTPTSPPSNEIIRIDHVDPVVTRDNHAISTIIPLSTPTEKYHNQILSVSSSENIIPLLISYEDSNCNVSQPLLSLSPSTINAILQLEHMPSSTSSSEHLTTIDYIVNNTKHHAGSESVKYQSKFSFTQKDQNRFIISKLAALRTDLYSMRLQCRQNQLQLIKYNHLITAQECLAHKLASVNAN